MKWLNLHVDVGYPELIDELDIYRYIWIILRRRGPFNAGLQPPATHIGRMGSNQTKLKLCGCGSKLILDLTDLTPKYIEKETVNLTSSTSRICRTSRSTETLTGLVGTSSFE